jgi:hypothetical protein
MTRSSSSDPANNLARLHLDQVMTMLEILREASTRQSDFVESIYNEQARNFRETLQFLKEIGWVKDISGDLCLADSAARSSRPGFQPSSAIERIAEIPGFYQVALADYLIQFRVDAGKIVHRPSAQSRLDQIGIRNFLMEAGLVTHDADGDSYLLKSQFAHLYLWAKNINGASSKTELMRNASERDRFGTLAELIVIDFEKRRLGSEWCTSVKHVSAQNPGACYDIQSLSIENGQPILRFIEVKAVSTDTYQFYWSAAELEAASLLRDKFFLYLLPATGRDVFDCSEMQMINDPFSTVYHNPDSWVKSENVIVCRRK